MFSAESIAWVSLSFWGGLLVLPWLPWCTREVLNASPGKTPSLTDLTVIIPARNEADVISSTLEGLYRQSSDLKVILVDDNSTDETSAIAAQSRLTRLRIVRGRPLPRGWSGKLWAQDQGMKFVDTPLVMMLDADIYLDDGILRSLVKKKQQENLNFVSLMARPCLDRFWERMLMPAFVYFFKLLYPFSLSNGAYRRFAAAAGGCIVMDTEIIPAIGGLEAMKTAIIDDCTLASKTKDLGYRTWIGLTLNVQSQRPYPNLWEIWNMIARTAYTQLFYSPLLLGLCTLIMGIMFVAPLLFSLFAGPIAASISLLALAIMVSSYLPTLRFYDRNLVWGFSLPLIAVLYLAMTWTSAWRYWKGETSRWKNRIYDNKSLDA